MQVAIALAGLLEARRQAAAEPEHVIRLSSVAPDGTGYARQLRAFAADALAETSGRVRVKPYFSAVAGDEHEAWARVRSAGSSTRSPRRRCCARRWRRR